MCLNWIKKISIYCSISYFEKIKKIIKRKLITPANKLKFNGGGNVYKEKNVLELYQIYNEQIKTTNHEINNFEILVPPKNVKNWSKTKRVKAYQVINGLQSYGKYQTLNPVEISIRSNNIMDDFNRYKNYKYCFLMNSFLFSASVTNNTNIIFKPCNGLNDAKESLTNDKIYKTFGVKNLDQFRNWKIFKGHSLYVNKNLIDSQYAEKAHHFVFGFETKSSTDLPIFSFILLDRKGYFICFASDERNIPVIGFAIQIIK